MKKLLFAWVSSFALVFSLFSLIPTTSGCVGGTQRVVRTGIVSMGSITTSIASENRRAYTTATDALRAEIETAHGSLADYNTRAAPITAEFTRRSEAIQLLAASLYATAGINDAVRNGASMASLRTAAQELVATIQASVVVLRNGSILAAITIPSEVDSAIALLATVVGAH